MFLRDPPSRAFRELLRSVDHRPYPVPSGAWAMTMSWLDLLFAHWKVPVAAVAESLPEGLTVDTWQGDAYLGVVPFRMENVGLRGTPLMPGTSAFPELNVRTYVTAGGKPGVWFYSLDAANALAVAVARTTFHLPYFRAAMRCDRGDDGSIDYTSRRSHRGVGPGVFRGRYRPVGAPYTSDPGSLEAWLTERYCLYSATARGRVQRGEIHHVRWPLQKAELELEENTVAEAHGFALDGPPLHLHFVPELHVVGWLLERV